MKANDFARTNLLDGLLNGDQICHPLRTNLILIDKRDALFTREIIDHLLVNERYDHLVTTDNSLVCGCPKGQCMGARSVNRFVVHKVEAKLAFLVTVMNVDMAGRGGEKQPLPDPYIFIGYGI